MLTPQDVFSEPAVHDLMSRPGFQAVAEAMAAAAIRHYESQEAPARWLSRDRGRWGLYVTAVVLGYLPGDLTAAALAASAEQHEVASRGRARAFVDYALKTGRLELAPGPAPWTQRSLRVMPSLLAPIRSGIGGLMDAAAPVATDLAGARGLLARDEDVSAAVVEIIQVMLAIRAAEIPPITPVDFFSAREGGLRVLEGLVTAKDPPGPGPLERATIAKAETARRFHISRAHLNLMLADAEAAGWLSHPTRQTVIVSPALREGYLRWAALQIQGLRLVAQALRRRRRAAF